MKKRIRNKISKMVCLNVRNTHLSKSSEKYFLSCLKKYNRQKPFVYERGHKRLTVHKALINGNVVLMTKSEYLDLPKVLWAPYIPLDGDELKRYKQYGK